MNFEEFKKESSLIHKNKYEYPIVEGKFKKTEKIRIVCPIHGEFWQRPNKHLLGQGCPKCKGETISLSKRKTKEQFIKDAKKVHGDKYDYSKVNYIDAQEKVCIICPIHGEFWQTPKKHLNGHGCFKCNVKGRSKGFISEKKKTNECFIKDAKEVHGDKYDYSKVEYINANNKVCIVCPIHGEFWQTPSSHLNGHGCPICSSNKKYNTKEFIDKSIEIHGNKYDYSNTEYVNSNTKVCIICPIHGEFWQTPAAHLQGQGCPKCKGETISLSKRKLEKQFIEEAKKIHGDKYDYSKVNYINSHTEVCIICPKHGEFWQKPSKHLSNHGCPSCNASKLEEHIANLLSENKMEFIRQKTFKDLKSTQNYLKFDFYIPKYNTLIECQGEGHYEAVDFGGKGKEYAEKQFLNQKKWDNMKFKYCTKKKIKLLYYSNKEIKSKFRDNKLIINDKKLLDSVLAV